MNILFVSAILPFPLYSGGQVRIYNLLKRLSEDHSITLCAFIRSEEERKYLKELNFCADVQCVFRGRAWKPSYVTKSLFGSYPFVMSTYDLSEMRETIQNELIKKSYDCIHIEPGYVWPSIPQTDIPLVVSEHNIEHGVYQEFVDRQTYPIIHHIMQRDVEKLKRWEEIIWKKANAVITVSDEDARVVKNTTNTPVSVIYNGIDEDFFHFKPKEIVSENFVCLFVGNFRWIQNTDAVRLLLTEIWPAIHASFPAATLRIVGKHFPEKMRSLVTSSVNIIEYAEDIRKEFSYADIVLAPIRVGGGTKYKILEAMASGCAVITTEKGTQGLPLEHKKNCYISDDVESWIKNIQTIIAQPETNRLVIHNARTLVESEYSWSTIAHGLSEVWHAVTK